MSDVLIVGAGLAGVATAAYLAAGGVSCLVVERGDPPPSSRHHRLGVRAVETLHAVGLADLVRANGFHPDQLGDTLVVDTLTGAELGRTSQPWVAVPPGISRVDPICCGETWLRQAVEDRARELGVEFRRGVAEFDGDRALVAGQPVESSYVVGADGVDSTVRRAAGIATVGPGAVASRRGVIFQADLSAALRDRRFAAVAIKRVDGLLIPEDGQDTWLLVHDAPGDPVEVIRDAIGDDQLDVTIHRTFALSITLRSAERYRSGRFVLVGDAACAIPPAPGLDGGRLLEDVHNLAWKLAAVVRGEAGAGLLDSYEAERRPIAELAVADHLALASGGPSPVTDRLAYETGAAYGTPRQFVGPESLGRPGTRLPDPDPSLYGHDWTLLPGPVLVRPDGFVAWRQEA